MKIYFVSAANLFFFLSHTDSFSSSSKRCVEQSRLRLQQHLKTFNVNEVWKHGGAKIISNFHKRKVACVQLVSGL